MLTRRSIIVAASAFWFVLTGHAAHAQVAPTMANVPYGDGHPAQMLDVYLPAGLSAGETRPCVVWIHGGGWQGGDKFPASKAASLLNLGFVVVSINYRLSGVASHPAQMHDCKGAIRHIRANAAAYRIDPARMGVWGSSAGGHLAALMGTSGDVPTTEGAVGGNLAFAGPVQAAADYFGPSEFLSITDPGHLACNSPESLMLGVCLGDVVANEEDPAWAPQVAIVREASPTTHVSSNDPPFHISYGTADPVVQPQQNVILFDALRAAGVPVTISAVPGAGHGVPVSEDIATRKFLARTLGRPVCAADFNASGSATIDDLFLYINAYFTGVPAADFNGVGGVTIDDLFLYFNAYFAGC